MLLGTSRFQPFDQTNEMVLPLDRTAVAFVTDLEQHVVEIVDGVDDFLDVGFLKAPKLRIVEGVDGKALAGRTSITVDPIDVVVFVERVPVPRVFADVSLARHAEALKQHDADVDTAVASSTDSSSQTIEVLVVKSTQIELRPSV